MENRQGILKRIEDDTGGLRPHYERYSLIGVVGTIAELFGAEPWGPSLFKELGLKPAEKVVSFIVDGLGYLKLEELMEKGLVDLSRFQSYMPITSVFPPTTTTALTSLSTGVSPIVHGVLGYRLYLPEVGAVVNMIKLSTPGAPNESAKNAGLDLERFVEVPTIYERLNDIGVKTVLFLPKYIVNSGLSGILYRGVSETVPYLSLSDLMYLIRGVLSQSGKLLLGVYWPLTDSVAHLYGPDSEPFEREVTFFFEVLNRDLLEKAKGATVLVTADHGFVGIDPKADVIDCRSEPVMREMLLVPPVGDLRAAYFFLRKGKKGELARYLQEKFPDEFLLMSSEEALGKGLWGLETPDERVRVRIGDLIALSQGKKLFLWPEGEEEFKLRGMHGGITREELLVPFLATEL